MLAKATCVTIHTLALVLSIRPPPSSTTKEKADKVKDEGLFATIMINLMPRFGQSAAIIATAAYILCMSRGIIPGELKTWQLAATVSGVLGYALRVWSFKTLNRFFTGYWPNIIKPMMLIPIPGSVLTVGGLLLCYGLLTYRVRGEEKMLAQHFGSEWRQYASQRWRYIPFVL
ncbi:hypothetical protein BGZ68_000112 [Mortierella alpina]|nr:hypothetical protein BGZ68_000112 [Mortierella alpina]